MNKLYARNMTINERLRDFLAAHKDHSLEMRGYHNIFVVEIHWKKNRKEYLTVGEQKNLRVAMNEALLNYYENRVWGLNKK